MNFFSSRREMFQKSNLLHVHLNLANPDQQLLTPLASTGSKRGNDSRRCFMWGVNLVPHGAVTNHFRSAS